MNQQNGPIISGVVAAIAVLLITLLSDSGFGEALIYAVLAGVVSYLVSMFMRNRRRGA
jgi:Na+-translocating ferredoxin:NAD+ oxidoreductase RnfD subunit